MVNTLRLKFVNGLISVSRSSDRHWNQRRSHVAVRGGSGGPRARIDARSGLRRQLVTRNAVSAFKRKLNWHNRSKLIVAAAPLAVLSASCADANAVPAAAPTAAPAMEPLATAPSIPTATPVATATLVPTVTPTPTPKPTPPPEPTPPSQYPTPPLATMQIGETEQVAGLGTYCWRAVNGAPMCADMIGIPTARGALFTDSPIAAQLRLLAELSVTESALTVASVEAEDQLDVGARGMRWWWRPKRESMEQMWLPNEVETTVELELDPGLYILSLFARFQGLGDASYGFLVEVK